MKLADVELVVFVALAVASVWQWRERRNSAAGWLVATFAILAGVVLVDRLLPAGSTTRGVMWMRRGEVAVLALFPYCLYRFTQALARDQPLFSRVAAVLTGLVVVSSLALPTVPGPREPLTGVYQLFVVVFVADWTLLSAVAVVRLWRAGTNQPLVAQARMRLLAAGAVALNLALLLAGVNTGGQSRVIDRIVALGAIASGPLFFSGFAPPAVLRHLWRRPAERALREAQLELAAAVEWREIAEALLPFLQRVTGANAAFLADLAHDQYVVHQLDVGEARVLAASLSAGTLLPDVIAAPLPNGWLAVRTTPFTPFFGRDELELLQVLGAFIALAIERSELFRRERHARMQIEHASRELEALLYGISHDLKNPIVTLLGYLELLREDFGATLGTEGGHFLDRMATSALYMQSLLNDLLELSRVGRTQTEPERVELEALVRDIASETQRLHPRARVEVDGLPAVTMNPLRARQLFTNLLDNAVRHAGREDVRIVVSTEPTPEGAQRVTVADNGRGIPARYRERAFGIFERLEEGGVAREGTGIGLAICRKIVETVGGAIRAVDSDVGARIEMTFPESVLVERTVDPPPGPATASATVVRPRPQPTMQTAPSTTEASS